MKKIHKKLQKNKNIFKCQFLISKIFNLLKFLLEDDQVHRLINTDIDKPRGIFVVIDVNFNTTQTLNRQAVFSFVNERQHCDNYKIINQTNNTLSAFQRII